MDCRFLIAWDHQGSGGESRSCSAIEMEAVEALRKVGVAVERVLAVAFDPEIEKLFTLIWPRVKAIVASRREQAPPDDAEILAQVWEEARRRRSSLLPEDLDSALGSAPKEVFEALVRLVQLRRAPPLYQQVGQGVSLPGIKRDRTALRIAETIAAWFPMTTE